MIFDFNREFIVLWKVDYASLECKNGVLEIEEVEKGTKELVSAGKKELLVEKFRRQEVLTLDELIVNHNNNRIFTFLLENIVNCFNERIDNKEDIEEYLASIYDDDTMYFYERKEYLGSSQKKSSVYYAAEEEVNKETLSLLKQIGFTGEVIERKGLMK